MIRGGFQEEVPARSRKTIFSPSKGTTRTSRVTLRSPVSPNSLNLSRDLRRRQHPRLITQQKGAAGRSFLDQFFDDVRFRRPEQRVRVPSGQPDSHLADRLFQT